MSDRPEDDEIDDSSAPLIEHLAELRTRLIRSVLAFSLAMMNKDLGLVSRLAGEMGLIAPVLETAKAVYGKALETGRGDEDLSSVVRLYEELDGQVIERRSPSGALA